LNYIGDLAWEG